MKKQLVNILLIYLLGFVTGLFTCRSCHTCKPCVESRQKVKEPIIILSDSAKSRIVESYLTSKPIPISSIKPGIALQEPQTALISHETFEKGSTLPCDTAAGNSLYNRLYENWATANGYKQLYISGNDTVWVTNKVQYNSLFDQGVTISKENVIVTNTAIQPEKKRNTLFLGTTAAYSTDNNFAVGASLLFQFKKGPSLLAGWKIDTRNFQSYDVGYFVPIRLRK